MAPEDVFRPLLPILEAGPWISAGRRFNYEEWEERERFVELDALIAKDRGDFYDRLCAGVMDLYAKGIPPDQIARRMCVQRRAVMEIMADLGYFCEEGSDWSEAEPAEVNPELCEAGSAQRTFAAAVSY